MSLLKTSTTMALLSVPTVCKALVAPSPPGQRLSPVAFAARSLWSQRRQTAFILGAGPFFGPEEEFTCGDDEECEIDWDLMPGFEEDEEEGGNALEDEDESDVDMQPRQSFGSQAMESMEKGRVKLEMSWQIEECETDEDTCTDFCEDCAGSGKQPCRFCRGTGIVTLGNGFRPCLICVDTMKGQENCSSCRGTGQIAPWASTMEDHLKSDEERPMNFI